MEDEKKPDAPVIAGAEPRVTDWLFQGIVSTVEYGSSSATYPVTILCGGFLVCGWIVSRSSYIEAIPETLARAVGVSVEEAKNTLGPVLASLNEKANAASASLSEDDPKRQLFSYFHLKDARFSSTMAGNGLAGQRGIWWRGRTSQVDGFHMGHLF